MRLTSSWGEFDAMLLKLLNNTQITLVFDETLNISSGGIRK